MDVSSSFTSYSHLGCLYCILIPSNFLKSDLEFANKILLALEKDNRWKGTITGKRKWTIAPRLLINVDHRIVGIIAFVLVNPLSATPLFSPARAVLFGLVVYKPRGRRVAKPKICRKASLL
jgi:hypothetical protein